MEKQNKKLQVSAIKNGTVIDHISADALFKVVKILKLEELSNLITVGTNMKSKKLGKKGLIKISDKYFEDDEINKIALISPHAKLSIIKNYKVEEKKDIEIPDEIIAIVKCVNPKCITNHENIITKFEVVNKENVALKCQYCGKITAKNNINIIS